jgi:glucose/arabinose dehydrogenase
MQRASRFGVSVSLVFVSLVLSLAGCGDDAGAGGAGMGPLPISGGATAAAPAGGTTGGTPMGGTTPVGGAGAGMTPTAGATAAGMMAAGGMGGGMGGGMMSLPPAKCGMPSPNMMAGNACPGSPPPAIKLTMIADGLVGPTYVAQAPGDPTRLYVTEQTGKLRVIKDGALSPTAVIDLATAAKPVNSAEIVPLVYGEGGFLGMAFAPDFETSKRVWLSYTASGPSYSVTEFKMDNPDMIDPGTAKELVSYPQFGFNPGSQATNHVGSMLAFGPDGCLYISRGDGGGENDRQMSGQDTSDDLCSILRVDPDTFPTPVPGNKEGHVWNFGFRNPWRFSFDRETGDLYIGDVGQDAGSGFEEVNVEPRGVGGRNYGWGTASPLPLPHQGPCSGGCSGTTGPALSYPITDGQNSVIGGYVYRGAKIPGLVGRYIWADWTLRKLKSFVYKGDVGGQPSICDEHDTTATAPLKVRSFGEGIDGELYVVAAGAPANGLLSSASAREAGAIFRIDPM